MFCSEVRVHVKKRVDYGNKYEVKLWIPPESILEVAKDRTEGMAGFFLATASREGLRWWDELRVFAASCYMQGINDAIEAETRARLRRRKEQGNGAGL